MCSVGSGRKWQAKQHLLLESEKRRTAFEKSVVEEQKVVGMTKTKCHLLEIGPLPLEEH